MTPESNSQANIQAIEKDGKTYIPLASLVQQLGGDIDWNHEEKKATMSLRGHSAVLDIDNQAIKIDGAPTRLDSPAILENDRVYVTPDFMDKVGLSHT
ncbi:MAG TPA: copper amine oxidase N-terminal domain-containing protein [Fimbriimonas sp.]|nr:copper amine oxidase N-terminal domain-containing protein [Fimbriimonas sp.]